MSIKSHYENHLAHFYAWMVGDLRPKIVAFESLLKEEGIVPLSSKKAVDLGAGHGIQSLAMHNLGFEVTAVDFNQQLLNELNQHPNGKEIITVLEDIRKVQRFDSLQPELITCCGDTLTHLEGQAEVDELISNATEILTEHGHLILSFRDYSKALSDAQRFISVKSSPDRILTCILEYFPEKVKVSDLLHELKDGQWVQSVSSYEKVRIDPNDLMATIEKHQLIIKKHEVIHGMHTIIAQKMG